MVHWRSGEDSVPRCEELWLLVTEPKQGMEAGEQHPLTMSA